MKSKILIVLISVTFSILIAELGARIFLKDGIYHAHSNYRTDSYPTLAIPNSTISAKKTLPSGESLYAVDYNFDSFGRRKTPVKLEATEGFLFFGCSNTFGDGLNDHETLPWLFSEKSIFQVYNYARSGYGPNNMLAQLIEHNIDRQIPARIKKIDVSFFSYIYHSERYQASFNWIGMNRVNEPFFTFREGRLVNLDNFAKAKPLTTRIYWALYYSKLARILMKDFGNDTGVSSQKLLCAIVNQSLLNVKNQLKDRFRNFYFIISPFRDFLNNESYYDGVTKCLDPEIKILNIYPSAEYNEKRELFEIDPTNDPHSNKFANEWLAEKLLNEIDTEK